MKNLRLFPVLFLSRIRRKLDSAKQGRTKNVIDRHELRVEIALRAVATYRASTTRHVVCQTRNISRRGMCLSTEDHAFKRWLHSGSYLELHVELPSSRPGGRKRSLLCQGTVVWLRSEPEEKLRFGLALDRMRFVDLPRSLLHSFMERSTEFAAQTSEVM